MYRVFDTVLVSAHHTFPIRIGNPFCLIRLTVVIHHNRMAQGLDLACFSIFQALFHLEAGVAYLCDATLADNGVVKQHRVAKVQVHMDKDVFKGQPIDFALKDMLEITASTHIKVVALRPVVDVVIRVEVAHADLYRTREHSN